LIAGVILAAGGSTRYGQSKLLLPWKGQPLIRHIAEIAYNSRLDTLYVILGSETDRVYQALSGIPCHFVINLNWKNGLSSSVKTAVKSLADEDVDASMFLLGDQPFISVELINKILDLYLKERQPITAPIIESKRSNPVLFDCSVFPDLLATEGDKGGRDLFTKHATAWLEWKDPNLLKDIDTPQDYEEILKEESGE